MTQKRASKSRSTATKAATGKTASQKPRRASVSGLKQATSDWQAANWRALTGLTVQKMSGMKDRGRVAAMVACAHFQLVRERNARQFLHQARDWNCPENFLSGIVVSGLHNTLGRMALLVGEPDQALMHYEQSVGFLANPDEDTAALARTRRAHEMAGLGLYLEGVDNIDSSLDRLLADPDSFAPPSQIKVLKTEIELLRHELTIALKRGQLPLGAEAGEEAGDAADALEQHATSQLGQDVWVLEQTGNKKGGFFVEFGATDGVLLSNTYLLETEFDWKGLLAEPNPNFHKDLRANRKCKISTQCIGARTGDKVEFVLADAYGGMKSHMSVDHNADKREAYAADEANVVELKTISLHDFLTRHKAPKEIDYISIDTEGSELEILETFPFDKWDVKLWTVEHNFMPMLREKIFDLMTSHGYRRKKVEWDDWYYKP